jgi:methyl coenzyme M reductase gamma subunit
VTVVQVPARDAAAQSIEPPVELDQPLDAEQEQVTTATYRRSKKARR